MRWGVAGITPQRVAGFTPETAADIAALGFQGVITHFQEGVFAMTDAQCRSIRQTLNAQGIEIVQSTGFRPNLVDPDERVRAAAVRTLREACRVAEQLGSPMVVTGVGTCDPTGDWSYAPHPDNYTTVTEERLIMALREAATGAEAYGRIIALEAHILTTLDSARRIRAIIDAVDSPAVKVNVDIVNMIGNVHDLYHLTDVIDTYFDLLGPHIACGHAKDIRIDKQFVLHLSECCPGDGIMDFATQFRRFNALQPNGYMFVEHLPREVVPHALAHLQQVAASL